MTNDEEEDVIALAMTEASESDDNYVAISICMKRTSGRILYAVAGKEVSREVFLDVIALRNMVAGDHITRLLEVVNYDRLGQWLESVTNGSR